MDTDSFVIQIITEDFYKDIANDIEKWFHTCNYDENKAGKTPIPTGKNKKVIGLFKDELGGKVKEVLVNTKAKTFAYLINGYNNDDYDKEKIKNKKAKELKKSLIKRKTKFENYTDCLFNDKIILKSQQRFKSYNHDVYTEEVNKIALSSNDDKRLQTFDRIETYLYGTNAFKACESEMMTVRGLFVENYADFSLYDQIILQRQDKRLSKI